MENEVIDTRVNVAAKSLQASDTLEMLTRAVEPPTDGHTLKVRLPPIFVILPAMSLADN